MCFTCKFRVSAGYRPPWSTLPQHKLQDRRSHKLHRQLRTPLEVLDEEGRLSHRCAESNVQGLRSGVQMLDIRFLYTCSVPTISTKCGRTVQLGGAFQEFFPVLSAEVKAPAL
jgi:hypothetical protein